MGRLVPGHRRRRHQPPPAPPLSADLRGALRVSGAFSVFMTSGATGGARSHENPGNRRNHEPEERGRAPTGSGRGPSAVEVMGVEPTTSSMRPRRSSQLSYTPAGADSIAVPPTPSHTTGAASGEGRSEPVAFLGPPATATVVGLRPPTLAHISMKRGDRPRPYPTHCRCGRSSGRGGPALPAAPRPEFTARVVVATTARTATARSPGRSETRRTIIGRTSARTVTGRGRGDRAPRSRSRAGRPPRRSGTPRSGHTSLWHHHLAGTVSAAGLAGSSIRPVDHLGAPPRPDRSRSADAAEAARSRATDARASGWNQPGTAEGHVARRSRRSPSGSTPTGRGTRRSRRLAGRSGTGGCPRAG